VTSLGVGHPFEDPGVGELAILVNHGENVERLFEALQAAQFGVVGSKAKIRVKIGCLLEVDLFIGPVLQILKCQ
jgi:hypothetical protein